MNRDNLESWLQKTPFEPFRFELADGRSFNVTAAKQVWLFPAYALVFTPLKDDPRVFERYTRFDPRHIRNIGSIPSTAQAG